MADQYEKIRKALEPWAYEPDVDAATMLRLIKTIKYLVGIAERGEGRKIADDETPEQFVLGYVKRLEQTNQDARAERLEKALKDIRSLSSINSAMNPSPLALTVLLGDIHHIADAVLSKEKGND